MAVKSKLELPGDSPETIAMLRRIAELEAALKPFADAFDMFAKREAFTRVLSLGQLGRLASGEVSGAHFKAARDALTK